MDKRVNIVLLGPPGAGKGTLAEVLAGKLGLGHLSTGDIFRKEISSKTELGVKISEIVKSGKLVSDELTCEIVLNRIKDSEKGFIFDGFPRTLYQAGRLDEFFRSIGRKIDAVVFVDLKDDEISRRLSLRRTCENCKTVYNLVSKPSHNQGICDKCGGKLILREDDKPNTVRERISVFKKQTQPLIDYYRKNHNFYKVDGFGTPGEVSERVLKVLGIGIV